MEILTITIYKNSEGDFLYDIYNCDVSDVDYNDSLDGGCCTSTIENALEMAYQQALEVLTRPVENDN